MQEEILGHTAQASGKQWPLLVGNHLSSVISRSQVPAWHWPFPCTQQGGRWSCHWVLGPREPRLTTGDPAQSS